MFKNIFTWYWNKLRSSKNSFIWFCSGGIFFIIPVTIVKIICGTNSKYVILFWLIWFIFSLSYPYICEYINKEKGYI